MIDIGQVKSWNKDEIFREIMLEHDAAVQHLQNIVLLARSFMEGGLITKSEVAEILRCTPQAVPKDIPTYKIGHKASLYNKEEVYQYIRSHRDN